MIPKIIHYCWFGGNPKSEIIEKCMHSWRQHCPDWEIKEWNETNFDISSMPYTQEAYELKKWAFVSDVARLHAVYEEGGIYLDTDVELLQGIDDLCEHDAVFISINEIYIASGLGFGASRHHRAVESMLKVYENRHFLKENGKLDLLPCPKMNTEALLESYPDFQRNGKPQLFDGVRILSFGEYVAFAKHYGTGTWMDDAPVKRKEYKDTKLKRFLREPDRIARVEKRLGKKFLSAYIFFSYDLLEMGPWYYIKRKLMKGKK